MKPTVMTTGPGVIMATATASMNWRSVSQWWSRTTPPYKNGMTARPLPNTNAPAVAKNTNIVTTVFKSAVASWATNGASGSGIKLVAVDLNHFTFGGVFTSQTTTPAAMNSRTFSDSVIIVQAAAMK